MKKLFLFTLLVTALLAIPIASRALPVSPNLDPAGSFYAFRCFNTIEAPPDNQVITGIANDGCAVSIRQGESFFGTFRARGETGVANGDSPFSSVDASAEGLQGARASSANMRMAYGFSIEPTNIEGTPQKSRIPIQISATVTADANTNAEASAVVGFVQGKYRPDDPQFGPIGPQDPQFSLGVGVNVLADDTVMDSILWEDFITTSTPYYFILASACEAVPVGPGTPVQCSARADPTIEFDQARFDELMGADTFSLADNFQMLYSPGLEDTAIPIPPSVWLFGSGLLGLIGIARRKKA